MKTALKKSSPEEGDKSGVPVEKDIIDESSHQETTKQGSNQEETQPTDELTEEDRELMEVIQNMKISVADLEKHSQVCICSPYHHLNNFKSLTKPVG